MNKNVCHNFTFQEAGKNNYYLKMHTDQQRASNINLLRTARNSRPFWKGQFDDTFITLGVLEREEVTEDERELEVVPAVATASAICSVNRKGWETSFKLYIGDVSEKENRHWATEERMALGWLSFSSKKNNIC